ncbi:pseudouridine synthase [Myroides injenensis]|uniref:pseudouridine synthase n=1 Tax=Myroides injenensis TaxID=1183151 RepID=UPI0002891AED|nr:S4 domain-containing protein [Myroides injenensis]
MNHGKSNSKNNKPAKSGGKNNDRKKPLAKGAEGKKFQVKSNKSFDKKPKVTKQVSESDDIRLNKYISNSGVCSRREADIYIVSGNVKVNGEVVTELGYKVKPNDVVNFDGSVITPEKKIYVLLNKPKGFSTINEEVISAENVLSLIKGASKYPLAPVGRVDKSTLGLMLFTNDSNLLQKLNSPEQRSSKMYQVSLDKNLKYEDLEKIQKGLYIDERRVFVEEIAYVDNQPKTEIGIKLKASNVKLVRALFEKLDYNVLKVDRVMYGQLTKWNLPRGKWRFLTNEEVLSLKNG